MTTILFYFIHDYIICCHYIVDETISQNKKHTQYIFLTYFLCVQTSNRNVQDKTNPNTLSLHDALPIFLCIQTSNRNVQDKTIPNQTLPIFYPNFSRYPMSLRIPYKHLKTFTFKKIKIK